MKMTPVHVRVLTKRALPRVALNSRDHPYACQIMDLGERARYTRQGTQDDGPHHDRGPWVPFHL